MVTFLIITGVLILGIVGLAFYLPYHNRPKFFRGSLKPFEKSLFSELENKLGSPAGQLISKQLACLKRGVRLYFAKSYTLELYEEKNDPIPDIILFERKDEFQLATLSFTVGETKYQAEFTTYSGRVWGMKVRPNPKKLFSRTLTKFDRFKLNNDPMEQLGLGINVEYYPEGAHFEGLLGEFSKKYVLSEVQKPLPKKQKELFLKLSETKWPADFLELCDQTNGFKIDGIQVAGFGSMQELALEDGNYLTIAEKEGGCLSIRKAKKKTELKYHSYEDETAAKDLGNNFLAALESFVRIESPLT
jgi:hypothetical protein